MPTKEQEQRFAAEAANAATNWAGSVSWNQGPAEVAALKSGLGPFYGRMLAALETIAAAAAVQAGLAEPDDVKRERRSDA